MDERMKNAILILVVVALVGVAGVVGVRSFKGETPQVQRGPDIIPPGDKTADR